MTEILSKATKRGFEKCAICMGQNCTSSSSSSSFSLSSPTSSSSSSSSSSITSRGVSNCNNMWHNGQRQLVILSCTHIFHFQCIQNFENFLAVDKVSKSCTSKHFYFSVYLCFFLFFLLLQ